mmetsp:Transcript_15582/g.22589  ORF Transcript_15582/g.22589 Transcript_15582/m.22589 type:complete len:502 (-) Transcript_15582:40-1545(-)
MSEFKATGSKRAGLFNSKNDLSGEPDPFEELEGENLADEEDEAKEVASQLTLIRKKHDKIKENNSKKKQHLERLKKELDKANSVANIAESDSKQLHNKIEQLKISLEQAKKLHEEENKNKRSYMHVLDRMKKDKIALEKRSNGLQKSLKSAKQILNSETEKFRKIRESKYQSRVMLQELRENLINEKRKKEERLSKLERNVKQRQEAAMRREERQKRQAEIAEAAANDDKDSHEVKLRESLLMHRFWYLVLSKKLESEKEKADDVERAFRRIRTETGLMEIHDIVEKFLTREQNYNQLLIAVAEAEKKLDSLRNQNSEAREQLQKLHLQDGGGTRRIYLEIDEKENELGTHYKEYATQKEKLQKSVRIYDQVLNWGKKMLHTLEVEDNLEIHPGNYINESPNTLSEMFHAIYNYLQELVKPILEKEEESKRAIESYAHKRTEDIIREMSTDEALSKIVRVRPEAIKESDEEVEFSDQKDDHLNYSSDRQEVSSRKKQRKNK